MWPFFINCKRLHNELQQLDFTAFSGFTYSAGLGYKYQMIGTLISQRNSINYLISRYLHIPINVSSLPQPFN